MLKEFDMELLERLSKGYLRARKKERSAILTQYQDITGLKRQDHKEDIRAAKDTISEIDRE